jgi:hypothetical protein
MLFVLWFFHCQPHSQCFSGTTQVTGPVFWQLLFETVGALSVKLQFICQVEVKFIRVD